MKLFPGVIAFISALLNLAVASAQDSLGFKGQLSTYAHLNSENSLPVRAGARYIPQLNYKYNFRPERLLDFEASANLYGNAGFHLSDSSDFRGKIKPYRLWARYSSNQLEIRAGLQKINFGSASILRPLMWFEQIDPSDPLKLTDGVWALLARYYFLNNANIWLWGLYGNENLKGWEYLKSDKDIPEFGSRLQLPLPKGEAGLSYHYRTADASVLSDSTTAFENIAENRFGFDAKFDMTVGWWLEASWSKFRKDIGSYTNQEIINIGFDYTFNLGNGLAVTYEQLIASSDRKPFRFEDPVTFSLLNVMYPVSMFDNIAAIIYYDWTKRKIYNFVNWQRQFNKWTLYLMAYLNPKKYNIPTQGYEEILYAGYGLQVMLVFNH